MLGDDWWVNRICLSQVFNAILLSVSPSPQGNLVATSSLESGSGLHFPLGLLNAAPSKGLTIAFLGFPGRDLAFAVHCHDRAKLLDAVTRVGFAIIAPPTSGNLNRSIRPLLSCIVRGIACVMRARYSCWVSLFSDTLHIVCPVSELVAVVLGYSPVHESTVVELELHL